MKMNLSYGILITFLKTILFISLILLLKISLMKIIIRISEILFIKNYILDFKIGKLTLLHKNQ